VEVLLMFITVEGLDGAGTTTLAEGISNEFDNSVLTSEPTEGAYGQIMRNSLTDDSADPISDFFIFMADRRYNVAEIVEPALESGKIVVSDRYSDSTRAYQPVAMTGPDKPLDSMWESKMMIEELLSFWNIEPDITFYLQVSIDTAMSRVDGEDKYEKREFLESVKKNYDALASTTDRIVTIDGEQPKEDVLTSAMAKINVVSPDRL
jgi:thymidylate kinase